LPELHCYASPILHQIRTSTSKVEAEQWVHANGGAGWIALQVGDGAGKTKRYCWLQNTSTTLGWQFAAIKMDRYRLDV
jgi:hypothetical protein